MRRVTCLMLAVLSAVGGGCARPGRLCAGSGSESDAPDLACTAQWQGAEICTAPGRGFGYRCLPEGCWARFGDGPCGAAPGDAGMAPDAGSFFCGGQSGFPVAPSEPCTAALFGTTVCPGGPTAGYGYSCSSQGCWNAFFDGPCAPQPDAGACAEPCPGLESHLTCQAPHHGRLCRAGCWKDVPCDPDNDAGTLICGTTMAIFPEVPIELCTAALVDTATCPGGATAGYGYRCTSDRCWSTFYDSPCAPTPDGG